MRRILLTGADGQVGWELRRTLALLGQIDARTRHTLDLSDLDGLRTTVRSVAPDLIVNAAAYTAVDKAESEPSLASAINGGAPGVMAEEAHRLGAWLVHYSTDYVFDGSKPAPYVEDDATNPVNTYGRTKLAGEQAITAVGGRHLVFRTSWVYAARGRNFLRTMLKLGAERSELRVVDDQRGAPTWARHIAEGTMIVLAQVLADDVRHRSSAGIYHLTNAGAASWREFAEAIFELQGSERRPRVIPIATADYPTPAQRPANSRMSTQKLADAFGIHMPSWRDALEMCCEEFRISV